MFLESRQRNRNPNFKEQDVYKTSVSLANDPSGEGAVSRLDGQGSKIYRFLRVKGTQISLSRYPAGKMVTGVTGQCFMC